MHSANTITETCLIPITSEAWGSMLKADVMLTDFRHSLSKNHKCTAAYTEISDFRALCDTHLVRAVFK